MQLFHIAFSYFSLHWSSAPSTDPLRLDRSLPAFRGTRSIRVPRSSLFLKFRSRLLFHSPLEHFLEGKLRADHSLIHMCDQAVLAGIVINLIT